MKDQSEKQLVRERRRRFIGQFYRNNRAAFVGTMLLQAAISNISLAAAVVFKMFVDYISGDSHMALLQICLYAVGFLAVYVVVHLLNRSLHPRFMNRAICQYKEYVFSELTKKSISSFSREDTGRYLSVLTQDVTDVEKNYLMSLSHIIEYGVCLAASVILMLCYSPVLTAASVGFALLPLLAAFATGDRLAEKSRVISDRNEQFVGEVKDWLSGFPVIKSFQAEEESIKSFKKVNIWREKAGSDYRRTYCTINILALGASTAAEFGVYFVGALLAQKGMGVTAGMITAFIYVTFRFNKAITELPIYCGMMKSAYKLIDKLAALLQENVRSEGGELLAGLHDGILVENLSYAYEEGKQALWSLNQKFVAGKSYAIVGASGSGKSTFLNLLMGSFDTYEGEVLFDGKELRQVQSDSLYGLITLVQQNVFIFNDTIRNNITMFREFSEEQVENVIRQSGLAKLVAARGEDYICGENGNGLSGGEKQRISIARALLRGAPVILMDEATAALDAETAYEVASAILDIEAFTRIVVTHRLEEGLLKRYHEILVMKNGGICEKGSFAELMAQKGLFYSLFTVTQNENGRGES